MYEHTTDHRSYTHNLTEQLSFNGIRTHDLCDISALLCQLSYQANRELVPANCKSLSLCELVTYPHIHNLSYLSLQFKYVILHICTCKIALLLAQYLRDILIWKAIASLVLELFVSTSQIYTFLLDSLI